MVDRKNISRRRFIKTSTTAVVGSTALIGIASVPVLNSNTLLLRPPGALNEDRFLASCIKCGQCLQVCPPQVINLAGIWQGFGVGTPYITPKEGGCVLCAGLPCVLACPTGSLDHGLSEGKDSKMGLAVISQPDACLSIKGVNDIVYKFEQMLKESRISIDLHKLMPLLIDTVNRLNSEEKERFKLRYSINNLDKKSILSLVDHLKTDDLTWLRAFTKSAEFAKTGCRICFDQCPIKKEKTISFENKLNSETGKSETWPIVRKSCVGCGVCEEKCPTPIASITIIPRLKWTEKVA